MQLCQPVDSGRQAAGVELGQRLLGVRGERVQYPWRALQHSPLVRLARQLAQHVPPGAEVDGSAPLASLCVSVNNLPHGGEPSAAPAAAPTATAAAAPPATLPAPATLRTPAAGSPSPTRLLSRRVGRR